VHVNLNLAQNKEGQSRHPAQAKVCQLPCLDGVIFWEIRWHYTKHWMYFKKQPPPQIIAKDG
jgi:hypothetical protein